LYDIANRRRQGGSLEELSAGLQEGSRSGRVQHTAYRYNGLEFNELTCEDVDESLLFKYSPSIQGQVSAMFAMDMLR
jgi:hypothetical protein